MTMSTAHGTEDEPIGVLNRSRARFLALLAGAVALGALAFAADYVTGIAGGVMAGLVSSGAAWGAPAAIIGFVSARRRDAMARPAVVLVVATTVYYLGILLISRRWDIPGSSLSTGESTAQIGLASVGRLWLIWIVVALVIGASLGLLGHAIHRAGPRVSGTAAGAATGLLLGEGLSFAIWSLPAFWDLSQPGNSRPASLLVAMAVAVVVPVVLAAIRRKPVAWWLYAITAICVALAAAGAWHLGEALRNG